MILTNNGLGYGLKVTHVCVQPSGTFVMSKPSPCIKTWSSPGQYECRMIIVISTDGIPYKISSLRLTNKYEVGYSPLISSCLRNTSTLDRETQNVLLETLSLFLGITFLFPTPYFNESIAHNAIRRHSLYDLFPLYSDTCLFSIFPSLLLFLPYSKCITYS